MSTSAALRLEQGLIHLSSMVGAEHVAIRSNAGRSIVVAPANVQQIAAVLRFANERGLSVMPRGGGTKLGWGNPVSADIELSLTRLCDVREHAWQDMTCTVQAGCSWATMQEQLQQYGQMVALDPLWPESATVGGIVACNDSGALRLKYGGLRDLIIGMTLVLADGTIAKSGGKVVKNVAGYDIHKLMTGSFGTLGVIVEVNFRLHPFEDHARTWTVCLPKEAANRPDTFQQQLLSLMDSQLVPSCVQLRISKEACGLDVRIAGPPECIAEYEARIRSIFHGLSCNESAEDVWAARQRLFDGENALVLKIAVLPAEIYPLATELYGRNAQGAEITVVAQANGLMTIAIQSELETAIDLLQRLRARVTPSGGSVVALQVPHSAREEIDVWGPDRGTLPLMREIKRRFDPNHILNPGRFVGNF